MDPETRKKLPRIFFFLAAVLVLLKVYLDRQDQVRQYEVTGETMGTIPYLVKYRSADDTDRKRQIDSVLVALNQSLSSYIPDSEISEFNRADTLVYRTELFRQVLDRSQEIFERTSGAFDPTIGPVVNAWGFGAGESIENPNEDIIDSLLMYVGFDRMAFNWEYAVKPQGMYLDFSAIAKGFAVDLLVDFLESRGIKDYMVEIGGEVRARGRNEKKKTWAIGIEDPVVGPQEQKLLLVVRLEDRALATSGNYRNYYTRNGRTFAHIIDPRTGRTSNNTILSASVFAPDCMTADAFATAFMVMGVEDAMAMVADDPGLDAVLVYQGEEKVERVVSQGIMDYVSSP